MTPQDGVRKVLASCPFLSPAVAVCCAIMAVDAQCYWWGVGVLVAVCVAFWSRKNVWLLTVVCALLAAGLHTHSIRAQKQVEALHGDWWQGNVSVLDFPSEGQLELEFADGALKEQRLVAYLRKYLAASDDVKVGARLYVEGRILPIAPSLNPDEFPQKQWLYRRGVSAKLLVYKVELEEATDAEGSVPFLVAKARDWLRAHLTSTDQSLESAVVRAMVLGERSKESQPVVESFKQSGTIHVFAVSGLHVMMVGTVVAAFLRLLGAPRVVWVPLVVVSLFFYAMVTGMRPPALRAAMMGTVLLCAWLVNRKIVLVNSIAVCGTVALLWNGHLLFLTGFQLSFVVLISIAVFGNLVTRNLAWISYMDPFLPRSLYRVGAEISLWTRRKLQGALVVGCCAWCGASPLTWLSFGLLAPLAIAVSLPMVLLLYGVLVVSILSCGVAMLWQPLGTELNKLSYWMAGRAVVIAEAGAKAHVAEAEWSSGERVVIYALEEGESAVYLGLGGGLLLDTGSEEGFQYHVLPSLCRKGAHVDSLIVSHNDVQHCGGVELAKENFALQQLALPESLIEEDVRRSVRLSNGQRLSISDTAFLEVVYSAPHAHGMADDRCCVLRLHWRGKKVLFVNDAGFRFEQWVLENQIDVSADLLVLGKHAYDHSAGVDFIKAVKPQSVVIQHAAIPSEQWSRKLREDDIELLVLEQTGAIVLELDEGEIWLQKHCVPHERAVF